MITLKTGKLGKKEDGTLVLKEVSHFVPKHVVKTFKAQDDIEMSGFKQFSRSLQCHMADWELIRLNDERIKLQEWLEKDGSELLEEYPVKVKKLDETDNTIKLLLKERKGFSKEEKEVFEKDTFAKVVGWLRSGSYKGTNDCPISFNGQTELYKALRIHYNLYEGKTEYTKERLASQKALKTLIETFVNDRFVVDLPYYKNIRFKCNDQRLHMILNGVYSRPKYGKFSVEDKYTEELVVASYVFLHALKSAYQVDETTSSTTSSGIVM